MSTVSTPNQVFNNQIDRCTESEFGATVSDNFVSSSLPRIVKSYIKSEIFTPECLNAKFVNKHLVSPKVESTQDRLFGNFVPSPSPRRLVINDTYRSNVFAGGDEYGQGSATPRRKKLSAVNVCRNPITGDQMVGKGDFIDSRDHDISKYGNTVRRTSKQFSQSDFLVAKVRQPPGGRSHCLW